MATNLLNGFSNLVSGLPTTPPQNIHTDVTHTVRDSLFYRLTVTPVP